MTDIETVTRGAGARVDFRTALEEIAERHGFTLEILQGKGRFAKQVAARVECYRLLVGRGWSTPRIGRFFNRDHSTVVWALSPASRHEAVAERERRDRAARTWRAAS